MYLGGDTLNFGNQWVITLPPRRRAAAGDPPQRSLPGGGRLAAGRRREDLVHRQRHQGPAAQERKEQRPTGPDRPGRPVHDRPGRHRHQSRSDPQHLGQGQGVSQERRDRGQRGLQHVVLLALLLLLRRRFRSRRSRYAGRDALRPVDAARRASYKPRLADDRVGHFLSTVKDFSQDVHETPNVRYVTRWNLEKEKPDGREIAAQAADHLLDRADRAPRVPPVRPRGHPGMEQGLREDRLHRRHPGPRPARRRRVRSGGHPLQHLPLDHHLGRLRHGAVADQSQDGRDPRCRHHLRRRHGPLLAAGIPPHRPAFPQAMSALLERPAAGLLPALRRRSARLRGRRAGAGPRPGREAGGARWSSSTARPSWPAIRRSAR